MEKEERQSQSISMDTNYPINDSTNDSTNDPTAPNGLFEGDIIPDYEMILTNYGPDVVKELEDEGILDHPLPNNDNDTGNGNFQRQW
jgi:hypothetical protein